MATPAPRGRHLTYADLRRWPEGRRWELVHGEAHEMTPAPSIRHQEIVGTLYLLLREALEASGCRVLVAPVDVVLAPPGTPDEAADTVLQPDVLVVCDPGQLTETHVRGAPDLVVEVVSPATALRDEGIKRDLYERAGVAEYWIVHPVDRVVLRYALDPQGRYGRPDVLGPRDTLRSTRFPDLAFDLADLLGPAPDAGGPPAPDADASQPPTA